ncbi:hypothetical protein D9757_000739 [Collybiopsis confluens]|uniref:Protein CASP n=1 Tax=Collybiopsis confluens TaxID=2823264 RepID=A0A8H5I1P3_9AGAR|nr:hypothetical protein D9757_000739 [Collybiopsis confluens]
MADQNFSGALATWRDINLSELQKSLDAQGIQLVNSQKESLVGRKALADKTKDFKKLPDEEKLNAVKGLLKAYQTEIDSLTKRCKISENAFLNAYKVLAEAPDPYPLLEAAVDQTVKVSEVRDLEAELRKARDENTELRKRVNELSSADTARKKAEVKTELLEQKMEETIQERVSQKENELNATYDEKLRNYEEREQDLQRQLSLTKNQLRDLRTSNESNQAKLLDHSQRQDLEVIEKLAEVDMIAADLERANSRVVALERRNEMLRAEAETMRSGAESSEKVKALEAQVSSLEAETERMSRALEAQKAATVEIELSLRKKNDDITKDLQRKVIEIDPLKQRLKQYNDYDEIKRELEIMKYVEFSGFEDDAEGDLSPAEGYDTGIQLPNPNADKANARQGRSLEALLATKNKRLLEELTKFRILHGELEASLHQAEEELSFTRSELDRQKNLNERLENDLLSVNKPNGGAPPSTVPDVLAELELGSKTESSARSTPIPFASSADTSILPIVTSQRDRFRQRNAELEEELRTQFHAISELRTEMKNLQSDNLKLYEKVRYMQSYREETGGRAVTSQLDPLPVPQNGSDDMSIYRARYEANINPFEAFRGREATRAIQNLNPIERGALILTRTILGNRRARMFFILYALSLHLLLMYVIFAWSTSDSHLQRHLYRPI